MGEFADEFLVPGTSTREIRQHRLNDDLRLVSFPTIGCLTNGYTLLAPISATREPQSLAELDAAEQVQTIRYIEAYRKRLKHLCFGSVLVAEHGDSTARVGGFTCACEREAHIHLIPSNAPMETVRLMQRKGGLQDYYVRSWEELTPLLPRSTYVLLSPHPKAFFLWTDPLKLAMLGSQAIRRAVAETLGIPERYNWREFAFEEAMATTRADVSRNLDSFIEGSHELLGRSTSSALTS